MGPLALPLSTGKRSLRSRRDRNIFASVAYGQISGRSIMSIRRLPKPLYQRLYALSHGMAGLCKDVESHFLANDLEACRSVIGRIFRNIGESSSGNQQSSRDWFVYCGGDTLFIRILSSPFANPRETDREGVSSAATERQGGAAGAGAASGGGGRAGGGSRNRRGIFRTESADGSRESGTLREGDASREETALWMMRNDCLAVLREMCFASACFSEGLSVQRHFLIRLFALMENKITFDYAVALAEEILAVGEETLDLGSVPNFARLVRGLSARQLSFFCRVLAMVVFEPEDRAPEVSALQKGADPAERAEREAEWAVADGNHDVLLAIPDILANLVKLLQMESSGEADLWSPSLSEWQPLLGDLMAGEDETAADWGPEEDDEEDYNEDGEEYEEEEQDEGDEEVEEEVDMEDEVVEAEAEEGEGEEGEGEEGEGEEAEGEEGEEGEESGFYEDVEEEIAGGDEEEGGEGGEVEEEEEVRGGGNMSGGERQGPRLGRLWGGGDGAERTGGARERRESAGGGAAAGAIHFIQGLFGWGTGDAGASTHSTSGGSGGSGGGREAEGNGRGRGAAQGASEGAGAGEDGGDGAAQASGAAGRQASRGNLWGGFGLFGGLGGLRPGGTGGAGGPAREGGAGEGGEEQEPGPDGGGSAVAVSQRRTGAAAPAAGVAPRGAADTTQGPFSPRSPPVAAPPPRMPPLLPPSPHAAVLPFSPHPAILTGTSTSPPRPPPNRTPPTATQPGALPQVNTIGIPMTPNPLNLLPLTAPANPAAAATAAEAAGAGLPAGARVMVFVGNPPRLLGEVPEGELEPFLRALPQGAVTVLRAGEIGLPEGAGPAAVATNMAASFMEQQVSAGGVTRRLGTGRASHGMACREYCGRHGTAWHVQQFVFCFMPGQQVEVLFVLCALCGGKRKETVQDQLAALGLVAILVDSFDRLNWSAPLPPPAEPHGIHGPGCSCNPESALKIQYLRLIHNFCDRDGPNLHNKLLLASPGGVPPPLAAAAAATPPRISGSGLAASAIAPGSMTAGDGAGAGGGGASISSFGSGGSSSSSGMLMKESADSVYRFWLASCVEAFLRGSNPRDQHLVAATGLMEHLVEEILRGASGFKCAASLQIDFDLLGELVKFNPVLFRRLAALVQGERFSRFIEVLVAHLVDSNVFIRSVMLSLHAFRTGLPTPPYLGPCPTPALPPPVLSPALPSTSAAPSAGSSLVASSSKPPSSSPAPALQSSSAGEEEARKESGLADGGGDADAAVVGEEEEELASPLAAFMECNSVLLLRDLMLVVRLGDINQDNIFLHQHSLHRVAPSGRDALRTARLPDIAFVLPATAS
ncbi:unnamed protein product [Closterium sp. Yama58-4]|nr:unnamed protein product [Closterium sp. Yama58-4]